jgi:2,3-bisphosphoglycerate-dependent phosphoglycerate mutase
MATPPATNNATSIFDYSAYAYLTGDQTVTELLLVRHGHQTPGKPGGAFGELIDPPLSDVGERQAEAVGRRLATEQIDAVYTSNLMRARQTGAQIARHHALESTAIDELREVELFRDMPPEVSIEAYLDSRQLLGVRERMMFEKRWDVYPYSEPSKEFRDRVVTTIEGIAASHDGERVAIACHGGVINVYIAHHLGIDYDMFYRPQHTSINVVVAGHHGVRAVRTLGDVSHLEPELITF